MDTLQVCSSQTAGSSKTSSRTPSPCRSDQMSKDRDSGDTITTGGCVISGSGNINNTSGGGGVVRFRNQSPSTHRRSRDRERINLNNNANNSLLIDKDNREQQLTNERELLIDHSDLFDDSRLSGPEDTSYQSFLADEFDGQQSQVQMNSAGLLLAASNDSKQHQLHNQQQQQHIQQHQQHAQHQLLQQQQPQSHPHHQRTNSYQALDRINTKIACTKESIRKEQTARDDNVNEYLKLAANADKQQLQRIKAVFEKKNQKSAHSISQLQKKLEVYNKRVKDFQLQQTQKIQSHRPPREVLRDVGQGLKNVGGNIRDGISGLSGSVMSKPREFAHLIKNKFGSADNINQLSTWYTDSELTSLNLNATTTAASNQMELQSGLIGGQTNLQLQQQQFHGGLSVLGIGGSSTPNNTNTMASGGSNPGGGGSGKFNSENDSECSSVTSDSIPPGGKLATPQYSVLFKTIIQELQERKDDCEKFKEKLDRFEQLQKDITDLGISLESERYRAERLEEQINDLTELHQNEIENLKQAMADMEEKVQYQSDERLRDVNEVLENCQTRISKMEHLSQQQYVTVEGIDNSNARALVVKLINVVLTVLQVVLLLVATAAGIIMPFLKTRVRVLTTLFFIFITIFVIRQWPDVKDIGSHMVRHLKESLIIK